MQENLLRCLLINKLNDKKSDYKDWTKRETFSHSKIKKLSKTYDFAMPWIGSVQ